MANQYPDSGSIRFLHILVADDLEVNQKIAQLILQKAGHLVDIAENGQQALDLCRQHRYDLILMDLQMPIMDGYEATKRIRNAECGMRNEKEMKSDFKSKIQNPKSITDESLVPKPAAAKPLATTGPQSSELPIIAMTGDASEGGFKESQYPGMNDCIGKPLQKDRLLAMILKWSQPLGHLPYVKSPESDKRPISKTPNQHQLPFDFNRAVQEFMGKEKLLLKVLAGFINNSRMRVNDIQHAVQSEEFDLIAREAHAIKGGAANLTAELLATAAADLEAAAANQDIELTGRLAIELVQQHQQLETYIFEQGVPCVLPIYRPQLLLPTTIGQ